MTTKKSKHSKLLNIVMGLARKRLEAKGWNIGSACEFLDLTYHEEAQVALRLKGDSSLSPDLLVQSLLAIGRCNKELAKAIAGPQIDKKAA